VGWSKVNTDTTFSEDSKESATASVIRDDQGALQAAEALWYERGLDACTMEALACRDGLKLAVQLGLQRVQLESDCLQVVQL
jgi:ribonuclease HI